MSVVMLLVREKLPMITATMHKLLIKVSWININCGMIFTWFWIMISRKTPLQNLRRTLAVKTRFMFRAGVTLIRIYLRYNMVIKHLDTYPMTKQDNMFMKTMVDPRAIYPTLMTLKMKDAEILETFKSKSTIMKCVPVPRHNIIALIKKSPRSQVQKNSLKCSELCKDE